MSFKDKIDALRCQYNLSIREVADRCEITVSSFQDTYAGHRKLDVPMATKICQYFKLDLVELCEYSPAPEHDIPMGNLRYNNLTQEWEVRFPHMQRGPFCKNNFATEAEARAAIAAYYEGTYNPWEQSVWVKRVQEMRVRHTRTYDTSHTPFNSYPKAAK